MGYNRLNRLNYGGISTMGQYRRFGIKIMIGCHWR